MEEDGSHGYEAAAERFMAVRSDAGRDVVETWAAALPQGAAVVDIGAGHGHPLTTVLTGRGLSVFAIEASPTLAAALKARLPEVAVACETAEDSPFFGRRFDAALAVGLVFLLPEETQHALFRRVAEVLTEGGRFLFSAPWQRAGWEDILTGRTSWSLGQNAYERSLEASGLRLVDRFTDEGDTHYYAAERRT